MRRFFPFLQWRAHLGATDLRIDFLAGLTVALVAVPQSLAYAQLAGMPPYFGLYAACLPMVIGAMFGSSPFISTGPVAMTALLTAASLAPIAAAGAAEFIAGAVVLALVSGAMQTAAGLLRVGAFLEMLLPPPVLLGFATAAVFVISLSQIPALAGFDSTRGAHVAFDAVRLGLDWAHVNGLSLVFGIATIGLLIALRRLAPRWPGVLVVAALGTAISYAIGFADKGGRVVGSIPAGMPHLSWPTIEPATVALLLPAAAAIALISFMEAMSSGKIFAARAKQHWDVNQELIGQGLAKIASALQGSFPVSGSFSRSALTYSANARTGLSAVFCAMIVLITLLFFADSLYHLPRSVLAGIIIPAVVGLLNPAAIKRTWVDSKGDGAVLLVTAGTALWFAPNIHYGLLAGMLLALALGAWGRFTR